MAQRDEIFSIEAGKLDEAFPEVQKSLLAERAKRQLSYDWVNDCDVTNAKSLADILTAFRWKPSFDNEGNIISICFSGEKYGSDEILFNTIAPYVTEGSFIEMAGEGSDMWRWLFKDGKCIEQDARFD